MAFNAKIIALSVIKKYCAITIWSTCGVDFTGGLQLDILRDFKPFVVEGGWGWGGGGSIFSCVNKNEANNVTGHRYGGVAVRGDVAPWYRWLCLAQS